MDLYFEVLPHRHLHLLLDYSHQNQNVNDGEGDDEYDQTIDMPEYVELLCESVVGICMLLLGLYAFAYALSHVLCFLLFEVQFDILFFIEEVVLRPYISIGMVAFLIILSLALSSRPAKRVPLPPDRGDAWTASCGASLGQARARKNPRTQDGTSASS